MPYCARSIYCLFSLLPVDLAGAQDVPLGRVWERVDSRPVVEAADFLIDGDTTYAIGQSGVIWRSGDRESWTAFETRVDENLTALAKGNGTFVAVGEGGRILANPGDGAWLSPNSGVTVTLNDVTFGEGYFVAVGDGGVVLQSADGEVWVQREIATGLDIKDILWDGSRFFAVGTEAFVASGNLSGAWTIHPQPILRLPRRNFSKIQFVGGEYIINGSLYSDDGVTYVPSTDGRPFGADELAFGAGVNVGLSHTRRIGVSEDSRSWDITAVPSGADFVALKWTGSEFLAMTAGRRFHRSLDGRRWTGAGLASGGSRIGDAVWTGSQYVVVRTLPSPGLEQAEIVTSPDGRIWTTEDSPPGLDLRAVASEGGNIVAVGAAMAVVHSTDGRAWQEVALEGTADFADVTWTGSEFFAVGSEGVVFSSPDGLAWSAKASVMGDATSVVAGAGKLVVGTGGRGELMTSSDGGASWVETTPTEISGTNIGGVVGGVWTGSEFVFLAQNGSYSSPDGRTWTESETGIDNEFSVGFFNGRVIYGASSGFDGLQVRLTWRVPGKELEGRLRGSGTAFAIVAGDGEVLVLGSSLNLVSEDGRSWQLLRDVESNQLGSKDLLEVIHSPLGFVAVEEAGGVWFSEKGDLWQVERETGAGQLRAIEYGGERLIAVGEGITTSVDGKNWTAVNLAESSGELASVTWNGERFVAVGDGTAAYSLDGLSWQVVAVPEDLLAVVWDGGKFVAGGRNGTVFFSDDGTEWQLKILPRDIVSHASGNGVIVAATRRGDFYRTLDGENWELAFRPGSLSSSKPMKVLFENGLFFIQYNERWTLSSSDGVDWTSLWSGYMTMTWTGSRFIALQRAYGVGTSTDGETFETPFVIGRQGIPRAAVWTGSELIAVGTDGSAHSLSSELEWSNLISGSTLDLVDVVWTGSQAVALDEEGKVIFFEEGPPLPEGVLGRGLRMLNGRLVVACEGGVVAVLDGGSWSVIDTGAVADLLTLTDEGSSILATGNWGTVVRSATSDPTGAWVVQTRSGRQLGSTNDLVEEGATMYLFRTDGRFVSSPDGLVWDIDIDSELDRFRGLTTGEEGELIAVGRSGKISRIANDGSEFSELSGAEVDLLAVARSEDCMIAVGEDGIILRSRVEEIEPFDFGSYIAMAGAMAAGASADADWDQDGVSNFMEYVLGLDSRRGSAPDHIDHVFRLSQNLTGVDLIFKAFLDFPDAEIKIVRSLDLIDWEQVAKKAGRESWEISQGIAFSEWPHVDGPTRVTITDSAGSEKRVFYRLEVASRP